MPEPNERFNSISLIHESIQAEERVLDVLIKNGCKNEDLKEVSSLLSIIYAYGFEVGKRCVKE
mgnify:CR=1 FL=1